MTKKDFVAVADGLIEFIKLYECSFNMIDNLISSIAPKLASRSNTFDKERFKEYILSRI